MKSWVTNLTGDYFQTEDHCSYSPSIAIDVTRLTKKAVDDEIKIQKEMTRLLRE